MQPFDGARILGVGLAIAMIAACSGTPVARAGVPQAPHRAFYTLDMGRLSGSATIVAASGAMTSEWRRGCDGWTGTQKLSVTMDRREGEAMVSEVAASVFETHDGRMLRFASRTSIDDEVVEQVRGRAERPAPESVGQASYAEPAGLKIDLPAGTLFPYQHTLAILDAATSGSGRHFGNFFDGSQPEVSPLAVNSLILGNAHPPSDGPGGGLGPLTAHRWWKVRLAFFGHDADAVEPEIELTQYLQENGVVRRFDFDYGDFTITATLMRIEPIALPACN